MEQAGIPFEIDTSDADETMPDGTAPSDYVEELSGRKAEAVAKRHPDDIVLGADTLVVLEDKILGKPKDKEEAYEMLRSLAGRTHTVYTGVAIIFPAKDGSRDTDVFHVCTDVKMYESDESILRDYAGCGEPLDKAGAYGIQSTAGIFISHIEGSASNVIGLPLGLVTRFFEEAGVEILPGK